MWSAPSESNMGDSLKCCKCHKVLPPCKSFSDYFKQLIHNRHVYVYNGGQYFRPVGHHNAYECSDCFNQPITDQERMRRQGEERRGGQEKLSTKDLLFRALDGLEQAELKRFRTHLSERILEGYEPIPRGRLEGNDATDVANKVMQAYGEEGSVKMTLTILRKMNLNHLADQLQS